MYNITMEIVTAVSISGFSYIYLLFFMKTTLLFDRTLHRNKKKGMSHLANLWYGAD